MKQKPPKASHSGDQLRLPLAEQTDQVAEHPLFGPVISRYTRAQAVADGLVYDAQSSLPDGAEEVTRGHFPAEAPVYLSAGLYHLIDKSAQNRRAATDWKGIWHDVLSVGRLYAPRAFREAQSSGLGRARFQVIIIGAGRQRLHSLQMVFDGDGLLFLLAHED